MTIREFTLWDTHVNAAHPDRAYPSSNRMQVEDGAALGYLWQDLSAVLGATVVSATLSLHIYERPSASLLRVRNLRNRPQWSTTTWNRRPTTGSTTRSASTAGATEGGHRLDIDVLTFVQDVADGVDWFGWQIETDTSTSGPVFVYSSNGTLDWQIARKPILTVEWADEPDIPEGLVPAEGVTKTAAPILRWEFADHGGDERLALVQVQTATSEDGFASPAWDSGPVTSTAPQLDLATQGSTPYTPVASGVPVWWRARHADGGGLWSKDWSAPVRFTYEAPASWDLLAPTGGVITDLTPTVIAQMSGATLTRWRIRLGPKGDFKTVLWDTQVQPQDPALGSQVRFEAPASLRLRDDAAYWMRVDGWDDRDRVSTPGVLAQYTQWAEVRYDNDLGVAPTASLSATPIGDSPFVELSWSRTNAPDEWAVVRNGRLVDKLDPADVITGPGAYRWVDWTCPPRQEVVYEVRPVENGRTGTCPGVAARTDVVGIWLHTDSDAVCLYHRGSRPESLPLNLAEDSTVVDLAGAPHSVVQTGIRRGWRGTVEGDLAGGPTGLWGQATGPEQKAALMRIRRDPRGARLAVGDLNIPVSIRAVDVGGWSRGDGYRASFEAIQRGEFDDYGITEP